MTGEWEFRTDTGRATVADGRLRVSGSLRGILRKRWREGWTRNGVGRRLLFVVSVLGMVTYLPDALRSVRDVLNGGADPLSLFLVTAVCLLVVGLARRTARTRTVSLRTITEVRRVDHDRLRVEYDDGERDKLDVETPTERDADEAVEILRLRGVPVEDYRDAEGPEATEFRRRLGAKEK